MKLKKIVESMDRMPSTLKGFNESPKLSPEQKRKLMEMVSQYNTLGQKLRMENALIETATALSEISELAETYACNEASDWFATEVVKTDFKRARGISETFQKLARECHGKVQQLNALYEDMGHILGRYYEIADPMSEVCPNPSNIKSQRGLPNAQPQTIMQEVKPNDKNLQSQRKLPANGALKEVAVDDMNKNIKGQRNLPSGGPAPAQVKEVAVDDKHSNIKGQRELPHTNGPATPQVKEVAVDDKHANVKSQRNLPSGGPTSYHPPKDPKDTGSVRESSSDQSGGKNFYDAKPRETGQGHLDRIKKEKEQNLQWSRTGKKPTNEVDHNESNLQSQRELPQGGPENGKPSIPNPENPSPEVNPAGAGEMNVKGERDVPQGGPSKDVAYESFRFKDILKTIK